MNRTRAGLICKAPQDHGSAPVREAATYLLGMSGVTEDKRRIASEAMTRLRSKRDETKKPTTTQTVKNFNGSAQLAVKQKGSARSPNRRKERAE